MKIVDAHVHFWEIGQGNQPWLENPEPNLLGDYSPMAQDYGPEQLRTDSAGFDLIGAMHVEADALDPVAETRWLNGQIDAAAVPVLPSALIVGADLSQPDVRTVIEAQLALSARVRGVRQILNVHADPLYDYVGRHYMSDDVWRRNFSLLGELGLSFDLQIYPSQMQQAAALAARHPDTLFMLNHAGMYVDRDSVAGWREWRDGLRTLAGCANVNIKLSGFGMLDHDWTIGSIRPLILEAIDAFGVERCMFASNFPVDGLYAPYRRIWQAYETVVHAASTADKNALFADNAIRLYRL